MTKTLILALLLSGAACGADPDAPFVPFDDDAAYDDADTTGLEPPPAVLAVPDEEAERHDDEAANVWGELPVERAAPPIQKPHRKW